METKPEPAEKPPKRMVLGIVKIGDTVKVVGEQTREALQTSFIEKLTS